VHHRGRGNGGGKENGAARIIQAVHCTVGHKETAALKVERVGFIEAEVIQVVKRMPC
jgi:hypothetical protein